MIFNKNSLLEKALNTKRIHRNIDWRMRIWCLLNSLFNKSLIDSHLIFRKKLLTFSALLICGGVTVFVFLASFINLLSDSIKWLFSIIFKKLLRKSSPIRSQWKTSPSWDHTGSIVLLIKAIVRQLKLLGFLLTNHLNKLLFGFVIKFTLHASGFIECFFSGLSIKSLFKGYIIFGVNECFLVIEKRFICKSLMLLLSLLLLWRSKWASPVKALGCLSVCHLVCFSVTLLSSLNLLNSIHRSRIH